MFNSISPDNRRRLTFAFRAGVSALIVFYLFRSADLLETIRSVLKTDQRVWIPAIGLYILGQAVSAYKWKGISGAAGFRKTFPEYIAFYFIGMFFNLFLPSTVGGDVIKCYYLSKDDTSGRMAPAIYTVLVERFTGLAAMIWILTVAVYLPAGAAIPQSMKWLLLLASIGLIAGTPVAPSLGMFLFKRFGWARTMLDDIKIYWQRPVVIASALWWSLVFHLIFIVIHVIIGRAVGLQVPVLFYFIAYPLATLAGFLPIALNGIGPREGTYLYLFGLMGAGRSEAMAFGILWLGVIIIGNLTGAIFYLKRGERAKGN